ncbi:MAG: hypothetical protein C4K48_05510, partial [Candidatus Thorarchaeota archaeon]
MRRKQILTLITLVIFLFPIISSNSADTPLAAQNTDVYAVRRGEQSSAGGYDTTTILSYFTREITGLNLGISNSYNDLSHRAQLNLSAYQVSGWTLVAVEVKASSMTAIAERATLGITPGANDYIQIWNDTVKGLTTNALYQAFYGRSHDGKLENYSLVYKSNYYDVSNGQAYLGVRSVYNDKAKNVTGWITPWIQNPLSKQIATHDCSGDNAILNASTYYYVVIDGSTMVGVPGTSLFNMVWWSASKSVTGLATGYHLFGDPMSTWYAYTGLEQAEAMLNYTYTPWNKTANAAIDYSSAEQINLSGNATTLTDTAWTFTNSDNIIVIDFQSNQSVEIGYDLMLKYTKSVSVAASWRVASSGEDIQWNVTMPLTYPVLSGSLNRYVNVTVPDDWTPTGLYNATQVDYGHYTEIATTIHCTDMTNGAWTLSNTADNYVTSIELSNHADAKPIQDKVSILVDVDIDISVEDGMGTHMNSGTTNLTIWYGGSVIHAPPNASVSDGATNYLWDIDSIADYNGTHTIEVYWTNGLEAGYLVRQVFVYYPTSLDADEYYIEAFTDNNFSIGIDFDQIYPVRGLDPPIARLNYTFGSTINKSMVNVGGGRWTAIVNTSSMTSGIYNLTVYGVGYALENRSIEITVDLTYETLPLNSSWSPSSSITYLESTNLTVSYRDLSGINITDASVNVTYESNTYDLAWDAIRQVYWIELHGENFTEIPGIISLNISAWKVGYAPQHDDTLTISIASQPGVEFSVAWSPADYNITFIENITISVTYNYNSEPIFDETWVRVTFVGHPTVNMTYNPLSERWEITLNGSDYLGTTSVTIRASSLGFGPGQETQTLIVMEDIPSVGNSWASSSASTDYDTNVPLTITVEDSNGMPIDDAVIYITINGTEIEYLSGEYAIAITPPQTADVYPVNVTMVRYGYTTTTIFLTLTVRATTVISINTPSSEYEQWNLTVTVTYNDTLHHTPITGATVTMTLDGVDYTLVYSAGFYVIEIVLDIAPGVYTLSVSATAPLANAATDTVELTVDSKRGVNLELVSEGNPSIEGQLVSLSATLRYNDTSEAVVGATVHFVVTITFENGTVQVLDSSAQSDITNSYGVATWSFYVPGGTIESIEAEAHFGGSRLLWTASRTITVGAGTNPILALFLFFIMSPVGRILIGSFVLLGIVVAAYNRVVKPKKREAKLSLENQLQMFVDLESLRHFMAVYLDRGTCVFYHPFTEERIQPDLISGFIAAITSVYGEIKGDGVRGTLEEIQYHGLRLNSYSGEKIIGILILEGEMTPLLKDRLQFFVELFENQYERDLESWSGLIDCFDSEWIVSTLNAAFNYSWLLPHRFGPTQKVSKTDARILDYIAAVRDNKAEFYLRKLLSPLSEMLQLSEAQVLDRLLALQDKGAIVPVGVQTVLQRQGMGLSDGHEGEEATPPTPPPEEEISWEIEEEAKPVPAKEQKKESTPVAEEPVKTPEPEEETDSMEAFVRDVESLLRKEKKKGEG